MVFLTYEERKKLEMAWLDVCKAVKEAAKSDKEKIKKLLDNFRKLLQEN